MKKRFNKPMRAIAALTLAFALTLSFFSLTAGAEARGRSYTLAVEEEAVGTATEEDKILGTGTAEEKDEIDTPPMQITETSGELDTPSEELTEHKNLFSALYELCAENADSILSALTCLLSLILMIVYKKGMMPTLEGGIRSLIGFCKGVSESAESIRSDSAALGDKLSEGLDKTGNILGALEEKIAELSARLEEKEKSSPSPKLYSEIMLAQIDMLYEIFTSAELPQYLKDSVGEKIYAMRSLLGEGARVDEDN